MKAYLALISAAVLALSACGDNKPADTPAARRLRSPRRPGLRSTRFRNPRRARLRSRPCRLRSLRRARSRRV